MTRVNEGSRSFICHPHVYPQVEWAIPAFTPSRRASPHFGWYSFPVQMRVGGWVGLCGSATGETLRWFAHPKTVIRPSRLLTGPEVEAPNDVTATSNRYRGLVKSNIRIVNKYSNTICGIQMPFCSSLVVMALDLRHDGREFDSRPPPIILDGWPSLGRQTTSVFHRATYAGQLSLLSSVGREMSTGQSAAMLCGWKVKAE